MCLAVQAIHHAHAATTLDKQQSTCAVNHGTLPVRRLHSGSVPEHTTTCRPVYSNCTQWQRRRPDMCFMQHMQSLLRKKMVVVASLCGWQNQSEVEKDRTKHGRALSHSIRSHIVPHMRQLRCGGHGDPCQARVTSQADTSGHVCTR